MCAPGVARHSCDCGAGLLDEEELTMALQLLNVVNVRQASGPLRVA